MSNDSDMNPAPDEPVTEILTPLPGTRSEWHTPQDWDDATLADLKTARDDDESLSVQAKQITCHVCGAEPGCNCMNKATGEPGSLVHLGRVAKWEYESRDTPEPIVAWPVTQSAWDRRQVHQLRQVEAVITYWQDNWNRPGTILTTRGAVILRAEPDADDAERRLGVRTDVTGTQAYLAEPLPDGTRPKALPAAAKRRPPRKRTTAPRKPATPKTTGGGK